MASAKRIVIWLSIIASMLMTSACSFKLRGQHVLPPNLYCLRLESSTPYGDFESTLRRSLTTLGVSVTRTDAAPLALHLLDKALFQDVPTIGGSNQARVHVYYYQVTFELLDACHHVILPAKCVTASGTLIINAGRALEATSQLEILKQELQTEATHMIINILNSPQVRQLSS